MHEGLILGAQALLRRVFEQQPDISLLNSELEVGSSRVFIGMMTWSNKLAVWYIPDLKYLGLMQYAWISA